MKPDLQLLLEVRAVLDAAVVVGHTPVGLKRVVPILSSACAGSGSPYWSTRGSAFSIGSGGAAARVHGNASANEQAVINTVWADTESLPLEVSNYCTQTVTVLPHRSDTPTAPGHAFGRFAVGWDGDSSASCARRSDRLRASVRHTAVDVADAESSCDQVGWRIRKTGGLMALAEKG